MINTQVLKGNLIRQDYTTAFTLSQGDKGVPFRIELLDNGTPYTLLDSDTVSIEWYKPNGSPFLQDTGITKGDTYIEITTPEAIAQHDGVGTFNIIISNGDVRKGTIRREYKVIPTSMRPGSASEDVITDAITELRELNNTLVATIKAGDLQNYAKASDLEDYVTKVSGKGLSSNDFTNAYKTVLDGLTTTINNAVLEGKKSLYPVGSLYFNIAKDTNPGTLLGFGTWERIAQGRTLVGVDTTDTDFNTAGKTGGSKTHTMTVSEMPAHSHAQKISAVFDDGEFSGRSDYNADSNHMKAFGQGITTETAGGGQAFSIMQPYFCVYIFKRTA